MFQGMLTAGMYHVGANLAAFGGAFVDKGNYSHSTSITSAIYDQYTEDARQLLQRAGNQFKERKILSSSINALGAGVDYGMGVLSAGTFGVAADVATTVTKPLVYGATAGTLWAGKKIVEGGAALAIGTAKVLDKAALPVARGATMTGAAGVAIGGQLAVEALGIAAAVGTALWRTRRNPLVGMVVGGGIMAAGLVAGAKDAGINATMNLESSYATQPNYYFGDTGYSPGINQSPVPVDNMGATGDLVFALNSMRRGGLM